MGGASTSCTLMALSAFWVGGRAIGMSGLPQRGTGRLVLGIRAKASGLLGCSVAPQLFRRHRPQHMRNGRYQGVFATVGVCDLAIRMRCLKAHLALR